MADRASNRSGVAAGLFAFGRSVAVLAVVVLGVPAALMWAARERFGGTSPFHGVAGPSEWSVDRFRTVLTDRLTEQTIADIVIRLSLVVAWVAVIVLVVTVIAEVVHMLRHDGLAMPEVRGLGLSQRTARMIASGLLAILPLFTSPAGALADGRNSLTVDAPAAGAVTGFSVADGASPSGRTSGPAADVDGRGDPRVTPANTDAPAGRVESTAGAVSGQYVVRPGDSVFGIAERTVGPDAVDVAAFAEQLVELNLGRRMPDGRVFDNAAFIDVGWVLELPNHAAPRPTATAADGATTNVHVVESGESLWSIADDELGDPHRWPEVYAANEGRTFADGRQLDDPDLIRPGWELRVPGEAPAEVVDPPPADIGGAVPLADAEPTAPEPEAAPAEAVVPERLRESITADSAVNADVAIVAAEEPTPHRDNVWDAPGAVPVAAGSPGSKVDDPAPSEIGDEADVPRLLTYGSAAMLSTGVLTLLGVRRRNQLRRVRPRTRIPEPAGTTAATERSLRSTGAGERFARVETAVRAVAVPLAARGERVLSCTVDADGAIELRPTGTVDPAPPWEGTGDVWRLAASTPLELVAGMADGVGVPCPALVQLGTDDDGGDVYVDLEAIEAIEVGGPGAHADSIVAALAATLAGSTLAEVVTLVGVGVPDAAFLGHRLYRPVRDTQRAFEEAAEAIGSTASMTASTFELRTKGATGDTWEPAVVFAGSAVGPVVAPPDRNGLAVVSAAPIHGPSSRLAPDGDAWVLRPAGIRLTPVGLTPRDLAALAALVTVVDPEPEPARIDHDQPDGDLTIVVPPDGDVSESMTTLPADPDEPGDVGDVDDVAVAGAAGTPSVGPDVPVADVEPPARPAAEADSSTEPTPTYALLVRLMGPVGVVDPGGHPVTFERSKTRELVAWLVTHRERSTRSAARTALWELDVRDATFSNVVSEARRSLARLTEPPVGEEWVGRTMTDDLPLHPLVLADADVIRHALDAARVQPPAQAIATLEPAVDLIVGLPFEGTSYLWPDSEGITSNLVLLATSATTELAAHRLSVGDIDGVFRATGRGLQVLPGHEELIGLRMEAHARAGDHAGIRQEWESYERVINADPWSDGEPAPKLVELRRRLLDPSR